MTPAQPLTSDQLDTLWEAADKARKSSKVVKVDRQALVALLLHYPKTPAARGWTSVEA